ncbi:MAG: glutathione S-transferase family protein [Actinobacteria bacterium]|nr:glutathione S-transferase family protein [Actinomycetota bacterium]
MKKLHYFALGPYPRRVLIYVNEKGIADEFEIVEHYLEGMKQVSWPDYIHKLNPAGSLPVVQLDEETGVGQSLAVIEFLEETYPEPSMLGSAPLERARVREINQVIDEGLTWFGQWALRGSPIGEAIGLTPSETAAQLGAEGYLKKLAILEKMISDEGPFLTGEKVTTADCVVGGTLAFTDEFYAVPIPSSCPKLAAWYERFSARPSFPEVDYPEELMKMTRGLAEHTGVTV